MKGLCLLPAFVLCGMAQVNVPLTVQEAIYPGSMSGLARTNEPVTMGVPLPDSAGISSTTGLGLTGASAAQFTIEGRWPSGNIKWVKVRAIVPSVPAGGSSTMTLTNSGGGNFGGLNLATDNGATITVATGTATFTVRKVKFNGIDQAVVGGTTVVANGTSLGLVIMGPNPSAAYPANVTCGSGRGQSPCTTVFASANDPNSTAVIEENGPAMAVIKVTGSHVDGAGNVYMHFTARLHFYQNKNYVKVTSILRNADYGTANTFATAFKGHQGYELRVKPNISGNLTYTIANHTASPTTGTMSTTDAVYIYQAESTLMKPAGWCSNGSGTQCVLPSPLSGYSIVKNGSALLTGTGAEYPQGWADISDANGIGVEIGQYQFAAYGNKSLEFRNGGSDVRVGIWAAENNTVGTSSAVANQPYYQPWPQWSINDVYLNFHASAEPNPANDFLGLQHYLVGRPTPAYINSTSVLVWPLLDPTEEDNYYASAVASASPAVSAPTLQDLGTTDTYNWPLQAWRYWIWPTGGVGNQMEFHLAHLLNFVRRGLTGDFLDTAHFYKFASESAFPMSDGFDWRSRPQAETQYLGEPVAISTSANRTLATMDWIEVDQEHGYWYGMPTFYFMTGDETVKDAIIEGPKDYYLNTVSQNNLTTNGTYWNARAVGNALASFARLHDFLSSIGDADAPTLLANGQTVYDLQIEPDLCVSGYPAGCTADPANNLSGSNRQRGTSRVRGAPYQWGDTIEQAGCPTNPNNVRDAAPFMTGILLQGLWEFRVAEGPGWANWNQSFDLAYGIIQWALNEMYVDNGLQPWSGNGFLYKQAIDYANSCNAGSGGAVNDFYWMVQNPNAFWSIFFVKSQYEGSTGTWKHKFDMSLQSVFAGGSAIKDELYHYTIGEVIYAQNHPNGTSLSTLPITNFTNNGGGSYTITWSVPAGATRYRIKWGSKQIVDWVGFNSGSNTFVGNPATTMNWFAATDATGIPTPSGTTQTLTVSTGVAGLTAANFMVKAYIGGGGGVTPPPSTPPTVSLTAPAVGATLNGTVTVSATTSASAGVASVQFSLDGSNLGSAVTGAGPSYSTSWNTTTATNGSHTLSASVTDKAGNSAVSNSLIVTVSNTTSPAASGGGSGTSIPLNTWTAIPATGWAAEILNYDRSEYVSSRRLHCIWGAYKEWLSSEHNNALVCYSYSENRWHVLENNGYWHSSHSPGVGHSVSIWAYMPDKDAIAFQADGSGSNSPESFVGLWWWYDMAGLSGQNREFTPRPWLGVETPLVEMMTYDPTDKKLILYDQSGKIEACDPNINLCAKPTISGTAPPTTLTSPNMVYNSSNNTMYIFGGGQADMYTLTCNSSACTSMTGSKLAVTCVGKDCTNGKPPARLAAGMAYSTVDHVIMMVGGLNFYGSNDAAFNDTWIFNPSTLAWNELSPPNTYPTSALYFTADRLTYDQDSNTFILMAISGYQPLIYAYPYSTALGYGRVSNTYIPPARSLNRVQPTAGSQSWVFDPSITASGGQVYLGWIESGPNNDNSTTCGQTHHPYIQSGAGSTALFLPAGTQAAACVAIDPDLSGDTNDSKLRLAVVNGTLWEAHEKINHNQGYYSAVFARFWTGSSWTGGAVGCFSAACGNSVRQNSQALIAVGTKPTLATIEWNHATYTPEGYIYVSQWNGTAWKALGPRLNINGTGTQALDAALATDGANPAACWSEQVVDGSRANVTTTPQIQCAQWNGSSWVRFGSTSLNQNPSSWASDPTVTYVAGKYYIGWVERSTGTGGNNNLYVCRWDGSSCTLLGGALNDSVPTGWAAHPSLATDGTNVYVAWEEQLALGQHSMGYVKEWNGTTWAAVGTALNADPTNGSVEGITLTVAQGSPTAIWGELTFGNLRQAYAKQWNGSAWVSLNASGSTAPPPSCDINGDGVTNVLDVQIAINQALGISPCTTADLQENGQCNVTDIQRVVTAALGGACLIGP